MSTGLLDKKWRWEACVDEGPLGAKEAEEEAVTAQLTARKGHQMMSVKSGQTRPACVV